MKVGQYESVKEVVPWTAGRGHLLEEAAQTAMCLFTDRIGIALDRHLGGENTEVARR